MFIQGMQACLGDDYEPRVRKQVHWANGEYESNKDGVPQEMAAHLGGVKLFQAAKN